MGTAKKIVSSKDIDQHDDQRVFKLIKLVRDGISYKEFEKLANSTPFKDKDWALYLGLSTRTLDRYKEESRKFQQRESERILELRQLFQYGVLVFEDTDNFYQWLASKNLTLGGVIPKDILDTSIGISVVRDALGRIEYGILA